MIYLDNAATTKMDERCVDIIRKYGVEQFFNPSALYGEALKVSNDVKASRSAVARSIGADREEIIFTASGSEADNLAMLCSIKSKKGKVIVGGGEHSAIFACANELSNRGYEVIFAPVDRYGRVKLDELESLLDEQVVLVSVMHVSNETGAINDIKKIVEIVKSKSPRALVHSDGVQAYGKLPVSVKSLGVDTYSISAHKVHGPKGLGALYVKKGLFLRPIILGGGQEGGVRSATENVAGIMALGAIVDTDVKAVIKKYQNYKKLQKYAVDRLRSALPDCLINTDVENSVGNIVSLSLADMRGEVVVHCMEDMGVIVGTGSACSAGKSTKRIPKALGIEPRYAEGMLRISFDESNTQQDVDYCVDCLAKVVENLKNYQRK
ncbi:MAG: cysteine desulfurase family protein [Clostridia bacterium]|nr:cysteine desulfurase family protein [Clostridia bacterium]MDY4083703.1 cysteine desulfurase family protein [Eubacteriales bacterium]